jgi:hypothetical protein
MSHNLNLEEYSLQDIFDLFEIDGRRLSEDDLRRAKKKMLMTHPDLSHLPSEYFLFYRKAFAVVHQFYQEHQRQSQAVEAKVYSSSSGITLNGGNREENQIKQSLSQISSEEFQRQFNTLFDTHEMVTRPDPQRNAWFSCADPVFRDVPQHKLSNQDMRRAFDSVKSQVTLTKHRGVQDFCVTGASTLYGEDDDDGDGDYISSDVFSKLKFDDLRKVHKDQTILQVSEADFASVPKYTSVDQYTAVRQYTAVPLQEHEAKRILEEKERVRRHQAMEKEYKAKLQQQRNEAKSRAVLSQFFLLKDAA